MATKALPQAGLAASEWASSKLWLPHHASAGTASAVPSRRRCRRRLSVCSVGAASASEQEALRTAQPAKLFFHTAPESPPPLYQPNLTNEHLFVFTTIACVTGGAMTALFLAAIPTMLAFKKAAESLEKLLEVTRDELPGTMAAVRLSGMEISDLTMELSDLGQEISSGVRNSARAVRAAQDGLRRVSSIASMAFVQEEQVIQAGSMKPAVGVGAGARGLHDRLIGMRMVLKVMAMMRYTVGWMGKLWWRVRRKRLQGESAVVN